MPDPKTPKSAGITVEPSYEPREYRAMRGARYYIFRHPSGLQFSCDEGTIHNCVTRAGKSETEAEAECSRLYGGETPMHSPGDGDLTRHPWTWPLPHELAHNEDWR